MLVYLRDRDLLEEILWIAMINSRSEAKFLSNQDALWYADEMFRLFNAHSLVWYDLCLWETTPLLNFFFFLDSDLFGICSVYLWIAFILPSHLLVWYYIQWCLPSSKVNRDDKLSVVCRNSTLCHRDIWLDVLQHSQTLGCISLPWYTWQPFVICFRLYSPFYCVSKLLSGFHQLVT